MRRAGLDGVRCGEGGRVGRALVLPPQDERVRSVEQQRRHRTHRQEREGEQGEDLPARQAGVGGAHQWFTSIVDLPEIVKLPMPRRAGATSEMLLVTTTVTGVPRASVAPAASVSPLHPVPSLGDSSVVG